MLVLQPTPPTDLHHLRAYSLVSIVRRQVNVPPPAHDPPLPPAQNEHQMLPPFALGPTLRAESMSDQELPEGYKPDGYKFVELALSLRRLASVGFVVALLSAVYSSYGIADDPVTGELPQGQVQVDSAPTVVADPATTTILPTNADQQTSNPLSTQQPAITIDESNQDDSHAATSPVANEVKLRFAFSGAPWREVLRWLADESGLALHVGDLPVGSFTYADPDEFTVDQAISRVNLFLIPQGYGVVKRGSLLSVISLADPRSLQQLDALAIRTSISELKNYGPHEIVKCTVPIGELVVDDVLAELQPSC